MGTHDNAIPIFTDGSKSVEGVGAAYYSALGNGDKSLHSAASVFTAELSAMQLAVNFLQDHGIQKAVIYSDSLSAVEALMQPTPSQT